jgi:hypothetical protein
VREVVFAKSLFPGAIVGDAVMLRVTGQIDSLTVAEVRGATSACPGQQAEQVAHGNFFPAHIPHLLYE